MSDYIDRQAAVDAVNQYISQFDAIDANFLDGLKTAINIVKELPSADVVEVVRCMDCIWYGASDELCLREGMSMGEEDYCSYGKRKDG